MDQDQLHQKLNELTDDEAERCLQVIIKGFSVRHGYEELIASEQQLQDVVQQYNNLIMAHKQKEVAKPPIGPSPPTTIDPSKIEEPQKRAEGVRMVLHAIADDDQLRPFLDSWFESGRPTLVDPITAALVLGGIVFVLSTDLSFKAKKGKDGKVLWEGELKRAATKESFLSKFFSLFK